MSQGPGKQSYVYKITNINTNEFYIGYRTCSKSISPLDDLGVIYFTSGKLQKSFRENPNDYTKEILCTFNKKNDAYLHEQKIISKNISNPLCKNINVNSKAYLDNFITENTVNNKLSLSKQRKIKRKEENTKKRAAKATSKYNRRKKYFIQYCDIETRQIVFIIPEYTSVY